jgi:hypothetical protein
MNEILEQAIDKIVSKIEVSEFGDYLTIYFTDGEALEIMAHCNFMAREGEISVGWASCDEGEIN